MEEQVAELLQSFPHVQYLEVFKDSVDQTIYVHNKSELPKIIEALIYSGPLESEAVYIDLENSNFLLQVYKNFAMVLQYDSSADTNKIMLERAVKQLIHGIE